MKDLSCKFCGGGKFVRFSTWMECWYCGSEFGLPKQESRLFPYNFGATYFTPKSTYGFEGQYDHLYHPRLIVEVGLDE